MSAKQVLALIVGGALLVSGCGAGGRKAESSANQQAPANTSPQAPANTSPQAPANTSPQAPASTSPQAPADTEATRAASSGPGGTAAVADAAASAPAVDGARVKMAASGSRPAPVPPPAWQEPKGPPTDVFFQDVGENPLVNTASRPTSTFSVDVDTASFTVARSYLSQGMLPPPESVRVEEFINYFPQGYPRSDEPVAVYLEGAPHPFHADTYLLEIGLQARQVKAEGRKPAALTFVVDVSGSMDMENRLGLVKRSLSLLLDQLASDDRVGLVIYGSAGQVLLEPTADKEKIRAAIDQLQPGGSTNAEEGIRLGYELAYRNFLQGGINRVILCSDGVANVGRTGPEEILKQVEDYRQRGITLTTVGFGMENYNDVLMERLADQGDGQYAYVDDLDEARRVFVEQLTGTLQVVAKDTKVQVTFDPEQVASYRLVGYENRVMANQEFRNDTKDAGEMGAGQSVTALYEVTLQGNGSQLGTLSIRYKDPETGAVTEQSHEIRRSHIFSSPSAYLLWNAAVAEFASILSRSPRAAESSLEEVRRTARQAAADLGIPESHRPLLAMIDQALELKR